MMRVGIDGHLERKRDRLREKKARWFRFPSPVDPDQGKSDSLVDPSRSWNETVPLILLAMGLPSAMERENLLNVPVEIPEALPGSFSAESEATTTTLRPETPLPVQRSLPTHIKPHARLNDRSPQRTLAQTDASNSTLSR
jgi:hypothetical protein